MSLSYMACDSGFRAVTGLFDPAMKTAAQLFQGRNVGRIGGEIVEFVGIGLKIVEFLVRPAGREEKTLLKNVKPAALVKLAEPANDRLGVLVTVGLEVAGRGVEIANVLEALGAYAPDAIDGFVTAIPGAEDGERGRPAVANRSRPAWCPESRFQRVPVKSRRCRCAQPDHRGSSPRDAWPANDEGDVNPFVVEKLLATGMADPVVGGEDHNGLIKNSFRA